MTIGGQRESRSIRRAPPAPRATELTATEWHVVGLLAQSVTVEEVAQLMAVPAEAVRLRRATALAKLAHAGTLEALELVRALEGRPEEPA